MKNILIVNAHEYHEMAVGRYNATLIEVAKDFLINSKYNIKTTVIQNGYDADEEIEKLLWANIVIFQFPKYWMGIPASFKYYLDFGLSSAHGKLYANDGRNNGGKYGSGGLCQDKKYMLSITMNAPKDAFNDITSFFGGRSVDELFLGLHKAFQFLGFTALKTFVCHDVVSNPNIKNDIKRFETHLNKELQIKQ